MTSLWDPTEAAKQGSLLAQRVYSSRLLGGDPTLVLHGGGNTSVKDEVVNLFGEKEPVLYIKGSGWDLATIEERGFPAVRMEPLLRLRQLSALSDPQMMAYLRNALVDPASPDPSVETLLHAYLPHRFVDHTHADAILTLTNQPGSEKRLRELFGYKVAILPYVMPGFLLAKACAEAYESHPRIEGMILMKHGIFTFGETAQESYERMIRFVEIAEETILSETGSNPPAFGNKDDEFRASWLQALRREYLKRGFPAVLKLNAGQEALFFVNHPDTVHTAERGPITPDHIIRTKRVPLLVGSETLQERDYPHLSTLFDRYEQAYRDYFSRHSQAQRGEPLQMLDPLPRVCLLPGIGIVSAGRSEKDATIAMDIYRHTADVILKAEQMEGYEALPEEDLFAMEYWVLEQAKLKLGRKLLPLTGKIAVITGGAGGIGLGIAREFLDQGACVHVLDIDEAKLAALLPTLHGHRVDVSDRLQVTQAFRKIVQSSGGLDILVVNAGIFPPSAPIEKIAPADWEKAVQVNLHGAFHVLAEGLRWMKAQEQGGDIVFIASRNVPAPGPQAASYSVTKAAQTQLARVCALEAAPHRIRVNCLHPHNILDTGLRSEAVLEERAKAYGMTLDEYKRNNLLRATLTTKDVAKAAFALIGGFFDKTTGAQIPVDGGNERTL